MRVGLLAVRPAVEAIFSLAQLVSRDDMTDMALMNSSWRCLTKLRTFKPVRELMTAQCNSDGAMVTHAASQQLVEQLLSKCDCHSCADSSSLQLSARSAGEECR